MKPVIRETMLTTVDNPWNPFTHFENWFLFDMRNGHNSCGVLERAAVITDSMTEEEKEAEINRACDEIIAEDPFHIYKKITADAEIGIAEDKAAEEVELTEEDYTLYLNS